MATNTHPGPWFDEEERTVLTVLDVLERQAADVKKSRKKG